jgi:hypothetical protein
MNYCSNLAILYLYAVFIFYSDRNNILIPDCKDENYCARMKVMLIPPLVVELSVVM